MAITIPVLLSDEELVAAVSRLCHSERAATTQLVAHLAEFDARKLHLAAGFPSLFAYCCEALHLSEHETYNRIEAARAARRFPAVLDALADGAVNLTTVRLLAPHLTAENHRDLLDAACHLNKSQVEQLVAERFPRPDVLTSIRRIPQRPSASIPVVARIAAVPVSAPSGLPQAVRLAPPSQPAVVAPLAPGRYEIRFTASAETRGRLRLAQDLLRHAIPTGDMAAIIDRALVLLIEDLIRKKACEVRTPGRIGRSGPASRHLPAAVRRQVWRRDNGRCAFTAKGGRRCSATSFLEFHHVRPYAVGGEATAENIELRCRAHNAYEADLFYAPMRGTSTA